MVKIIKGLILGLIIASFVCGCSSSSNIKEISLNEFNKKIENKENFVLYVGNEGCHNCVSYEPKLKEVLKEYNLTIYKLDNSKLSEDEFNKLNEKFSVSGTPTIMFITKGNEETTLNRIVGDTSKEKTIEKFKVNGYIK